MLRLDPTEHGVILPVLAHAHARRNGIVGLREGMLRVAVTAAPEKGKANRAIVGVLSRTLGISKSSIELVSGETAPRKRFLVVGATADQLRHALSEFTQTGQLDGESAAEPS